MCCLLIYPDRLSAGSRSRRPHPPSLRPGPSARQRIRPWRACVRPRRRAPAIAFLDEEFQVLLAAIKDTVRDLASTGLRTCSSLRPGSTDGSRCCRLLGSYEMQRDGCRLVVDAGITCAHNFHSPDMLMLPKEEGRKPIKRFRRAGRLLVRFQQLVQPAHRCRPSSPGTTRFDRVRITDRGSSQGPQRDFCRDVIRCGVNFRRLYGFAKTLLRSIAGLDSSLARASRKV